MEQVLSREKVVAATPAQVFDLLADPRRHVELDGSGHIEAPREGNPERLSAGATFVMTMHRSGLRYGIRSEVVEFEENRRIAWRIRPEGRFTWLREQLVGGHFWRYELEAVEGGTLVTESWDWRGVRLPIVIRALGFPRQNARGIEATLERLAARFSVEG